MDNASNTQLVSELAGALRGLRLLGDHEQFMATTLSGGVSCDVFLFETAGRDPLVVKRALPKLKVEADWRAPVGRAETEVEWIRFARQLDPRIAPRVVAHDPDRHLFVMSYLPKTTYPIWKHELAAGHVDIAFAASIGHWLGRLHRSSAGVHNIATRFADVSQFSALRLEPYLAHAATRNPDLAPALQTLIDSIASSRISLMQGDVSPKNILHGPEAPVFLDAETACYGDPAFDLAFCLNHLLLKCVWRPEFRKAYIDAFVALKQSYCSEVGWELPAQLESRAARIIAGLLLARVDGKSPVEYITKDDEKAFVRREAHNYIVDRRDSLEEIADDWLAAVGAYSAGTGSR